MVDEHTRLEQMRRDIATSTDPAWTRDHYGVHQHSKTFIIAIALIGALAFYAVFAAVASI